MHRISRRTFTSLVIAGGLPRTVSAGGPSLRIKPDHGAAGESVTARGRNFSPAVDGSVTWPDGTKLGTFTTDDDGDFEISITLPHAAAGTFEITATAGTEHATDVVEIEADEDLSATPPVAAVRPDLSPEPVTLPDEPSFVPLREVSVSTADELTSAFANAKPGDRITLGSGSYIGNFVVDASGTEEHRIQIVGTRDTVIDGDGWEHSGYAMHVTGSWVVLSGMTVTNAQKGVVVDSAQHVMVVSAEVHTIGHEAIHIRQGSNDASVWGNEIHHTGLDQQKFGEGVYIGSAVSNWGKYSNGEPDICDRASIRNNLIWATSSECIDLKEGTTGGIVEGNVFDGTGMTGADSWVDVKGNEYIIRSNHGMNSPKDGFQTHVIDNMDWGRDNTFEANVAEVNGPGVGFYLHQADQTNNVVSCDNTVTGAAGGFSSVSELCSG